MWDLHDEITRASGQALFDDAIMLLDMAPDGTPPFRLEVERDWWASGSETYALVFAVVDARGRSYRYIVKSFVTIGSPISERVDELVRRRQHVESLGVQVPRLLFRTGGDIYEEYIDKGIREAGEVSEATARELFAALNSTIQLLEAAGYSPISLHDVRSRGTDCVLVDFGEDLGSPCATGSKSVRNRLIAGVFGSREYLLTPNPWNLGDDRGRE